MIGGKVCKTYYQVSNRVFPQGIKAFNNHLAEMVAVNASKGTVDGTFYLK